jgi:hypothetical protein
LKKICHYDSFLKIIDSICWMWLGRVEGYEVDLVIFYPGCYFIILVVSNRQFNRRIDGLAAGTSMISVLTLVFLLSFLNIIISQLFKTSCISNSEMTVFIYVCWALLVSLGTTPIYHPVFMGDQVWTMGGLCRCGYCSS